MLNYFCIGLGVFLTSYVVNLAHPDEDPSSAKHIWYFLMDLFTWPLILAGNLLLALETRKARVAAQKLFAEIEQHKEEG